MKSGNQAWEKAVQRILKEYEDAHADLNCKGHFEFKEVRDTLFPLGALGPIPAPLLPMVVCNHCESAYVLPGFEELLSTIIATQLVLSRELLTKKQIKFLRQHFDLKQEALAKRIGVADKHEFSKMESEASPRHMSPETQLRMKLVYAKMLGVKEVEKIYEMTEIDDSKTAQIDPKLFISAVKLRKAAGWT